MKRTFSMTDGPNHPEPFPTDGKTVKLLTCPVCKNKGVPYWFAPTEKHFKTTCRKCGATHVIHPKDHDFKGRNRGHSPQLDGYTKPAVPRKVDEGALDATSWWRDVLDRRDLGDTWWKR